MPTLRPPRDPTSSATTGATTTGTATTATAEQQTEIEAILGDYRERMKALHDEFDSAYTPRYWAIVDSTRSSIRGVLDASQQERYDSITTAWDERRRDGGRWDR